MYVCVYTKRDTPEPECPRGRGTEDAAHSHQLALVAAVASV